jgi:formamidopyrimidine-DNA glycosylase
MPELPDLLYICTYLNANVKGRKITGVTVKQPVVIRTTLNEPFDRSLVGSQIMEIFIWGPFFRFFLSSDRELIINLMLAGHLQHQRPGERPEGHLCVTIELDDASRLNLSDNTLMAKLYCTARGQYEKVPRFRERGLDVLSDKFTHDAFLTVAAQHRRKQVRVFLNDQTILSAIGNAYADEILFEAGIHPKTLIAHLDKSQLRRLHASIRSILEWGTRQVENAAQPIQVKIRDHMRVRNRKGQPCPRCGAIIRREGVHGHDVFFCPRCQPATRSQFLDWRKLEDRKNA